MIQYLEVNPGKDEEAVFVNTSTILSIRVIQIGRGYGVFIYVHGASYMCGDEYPDKKRAETAAKSLISRISGDGCYYE